MSISSLVSVLMSTRIWVHIHLFYMSTAVLCQHDLISSNDWNWCFVKWMFRPPSDNFGIIVAAFHRLPKKKHRLKRGT